MTNMSDYRSWTKVNVMPPKTAKPFEPATRSFAEQAKRDNRAAMASWDKTGGVFASNREAIEARRLEWLAVLPEGPFDRITARAALGVKDAAGDNRIEALEREGLITRIPARPLKWVKA